MANIFGNMSKKMDARRISVKAKGKCLFVILLFVMLLSFPGVAYAQFNDYGYNAEGRIFKGTLDNWEALLSGSPPAPFDPKGTDIVFIDRKWDKLFDPMLHNSLPSTGAWQKAELWEYLSGDQLGWTWHLDLEVVYSPDTPISGAMVLPPEVMGGVTGFYGVEYNEWLVGPAGEKTLLQDFSVNRGIIEKALHFS